MTAPLTHAECMARLLACPALPRGERLAQFCESEAKWSRERYPLFLTLMCNEYGHMPHGPSGSEFRRVAAPLRRAREERREARMYMAIFQRQRDELDERVDELREYRLRALRAENGVDTCHKKNSLLRSVLMTALLHIDGGMPDVAEALRARLKDGE